MIVGARTAAWAKSGYTAKDYVQDGLIAMWDGIENAGWGVHNPNATTCIDLSGNGHDLILTQRQVVNDDSIEFLGNGCASYNTEFGGSVKSIDILCLFPNENSAPVAYLGAYKDRILNRKISYFSFDGFSYKGIKTNGINKVSCLSANYSGVADGANSWEGFVDGLAVNQSKGVCERWTVSSNRYIGGTSGGTYSQPMRLYSMKIYDRQRTAEEIAANYAIDKARFNLP